MIRHDNRRFQFVQIIFFINFNPDKPQKPQKFNKNVEENVNQIACMIAEPGLWPKNQLANRKTKRGKQNRSDAKNR